MCAVPYTCVYLTFLELPNIVAQKLKSTRNHIKKARWYFARRTIIQQQYQQQRLCTVPYLIVLYCIVFQKYSLYLREFHCIRHTTLIPIFLPFPSSFFTVYFFGFVLLEASGVFGNTPSIAPMKPYTVLWKMCRTYRTIVFTHRRLMKSAIFFFFSRHTHRKRFTQYIHIHYIAR